MVSFFAALGDVLKPKSFAGLFGAAPSVALATLGLTVLADGKAFASTEARSMIAGAGAFVIYAYVVSRILLTGRWRTAPITIGALVVWLGVSLGGWWAFLR